MKPTRNAGNTVGGGSPANSSSTSGTDKAIARLLYAMLRQKSLKDIDWNKVAQDPCLLEEISNGHAARMRFSRFRNTVENQGKARRSRMSGGSTTSEASAGSTSSFKAFRVTKPKRDSSTAKQLADGSLHSGHTSLQRRNTPVKDEDARSDGYYLDEDVDSPVLSESLSPRPSTSGELDTFVTTTRAESRRLVKAEAASAGTQVLTCTPHSMPANLFAICPPEYTYDGSTYVRNQSLSPAPDVHMAMRTRFLTPCSDIESRQIELTTDNGPAPSVANTAASDYVSFSTATANAAALAAAHYTAGGDLYPWIVADRLRHQQPQQQQQQQQHQGSSFTPPMSVYDSIPSMDPVLAPQKYHQSLLQHPQQGSLFATTPEFGLGQSSLEAHAFSGHGNGWNAMLNPTNAGEDRGESHEMLDCV